MQIKLNNDVHNLFYDNLILDFCIHSLAVKDMEPETIFEIELENFPFYLIKQYYGCWKPARYEQSVNKEVCEQFNSILQNI